MTTTASATRPRSLVSPFADLARFTRAFSARLAQTAPPLTETVRPALQHVSSVTTDLAETVRPVLEHVSSVTTDLAKTLRPVLEVAEAAFDDFIAAGGHEAAKWGRHWNRRRPWVQFTRCSSETRGTRTLHDASAWTRLHAGADVRSLHTRPAAGSSDLLLLALDIAPGAPNATAAALPPALRRLSTCQHPQTP